jgi:HSP20 family molecular chaperone IbpA
VTESSGVGDDAEDSGESNLETLLDDLVKQAEELIDQPYRRDHEPEGEAPRRSIEMIEGRDELTVLLEMPGYRLQEFGVSVTDAELVMDTPEFRSKRALPCRVAPETATSEYRNGILSVKVAKVA